MPPRYTELGHRLTELLGSQPKIAAVLGVSQQAVSYKLTGVAPITLADLEKVAAVIHAPMTIFFEKRGTDGAVLNAFHAMHMHAPDALDSIISAFRHNRRTLRKLAKLADKLVQETEPELRRRDYILSAGVADGDVVIPPPHSDTKEETE
jgi:transcriptional regulator with XRE-family HTH domain